MAGYIGTKAVLLSTTAATVTGDSTVGGDLTVDTNTLFVDSTNNRVGIGTSIPQTNVHVQSSGDTAIQITKEGSIASRIKTVSGALTVGLDSANGDTERMRIDSNGDVIVGGTSSGADGAVTLSNTGAIDYDISTTNGGGLNVKSIYTFNDNNTNTVGSLNWGFSVLILNQGTGAIILPFFQNAGGGVAWSGSLFDPDSGSFVYGNGPSVTFTAAGSGGNTYTVAMVGGSGVCTVRRTAGSQAYTATICALLA